MSEEKWTNEQVLEEVFRPIIKSIYEKAGDHKTRQELIEALENPNPDYFFWRLVNLQKGPLLFFIGYLNGGVGPTEWPEVDLVNAKTRETLSTDFHWEFSGVDIDFRDENGIPENPMVLEVLRRILQEHLSELRAASGFQVRDKFCPFCGRQGALLFLVYTDKNVVAVECNECATVWRDPEAVHSQNALRPNPLTRMVPELNCLLAFARCATYEEIVAQGWEAYMQE